VPIIGFWYAPYDYHQLVLYSSTPQGLERRADKQIARQEAALVRAVIRVWKAHERGQLLGRVQDARLLRQVWEAWKRRLRHQKELEGVAGCQSIIFRLTYGCWNV
jgi:hypothetical protein